MLQQFHSKFEIDDLFRKIIEEKFELMQRIKADNPNLLLPKDFSKFITERLFMDFLLSIYDYCVELHSLEKKQQILEAQGKDRVALAPKLLSSETDKINIKLKEISEIYCKILLKKGSCNVMIKDQKFFETLIYFITQVLKEIFEKEDYKFVEEEINRIFRTNPFNMLKRKHISENIDSKHQGPKDIKELKGDMNYKRNKEEDELAQELNKRVRRVYARKGMPKSIDREMMVEKSSLKPYFIKSTRCAAINSRSPLIAIVFPSAKERLFQLEQERKQRTTKFTSKIKLDTTNINMWIEDLEVKRVKTKSEHEHNSTYGRHKGSQSFHQ